MSQSASPAVGFPSLRFVITAITRCCFVPFADFQFEEQPTRVCSAATEDTLSTCASGLKSVPSVQRVVDANVWLKRVLSTVTENLDLIPINVRFKSKQLVFSFGFL